MLKAVVQDEPFNAALRELAPASEAIGADAEKNALAQAFREQPHFVAGGTAG